MSWDMVSTMSWNQTLSPARSAWPQRLGLWWQTGFRHTRAKR